MMMTRQITFLGAATIALAAAMPAAAQDNNIGKRVERLEKEMRAVQRSVFPGGSPTFFEGEIAPDNTPGERSRANAPVIDLTARVDALEAQLQTLTGQTEQNAYHLRELEKAFTAYKAEMDKRFADPAAVDPAAADPTASPASLAPVVKAPTTAAATPTKKPADKPAAKPGAPDATRLALVKKVEVPSTGNETKDAYDYGYRLWDA